MMAFLMPHRYFRPDVNQTKFPPSWQVIGQKCFEKQRFGLSSYQKSQKDPFVHVVFQILELNEIPREPYKLPEPNGWVFVKNSSKKNNLSPIFYDFAVFRLGSRAGRNIEDNPVYPQYYWLIKLTDTNLRASSQKLRKHLEGYNWRPFILNAGWSYLSKPILIEVINKFFNELKKVD